MRISAFAALLLAACTATPPATTAEQPSPAAQPRWTSAADGAGASLTHVDAGGTRRATLRCHATGEGLLVNVSGFSPVASEERMSLGAGSVVTVLVADTAGDRARGGVSGEAPVPAELAAIVGSPAGVRINYGYQDIGPLPAIPADQARAFVTRCGG